MLAPAWDTRLTPVHLRVEMTDAAAPAADISALSFEEALAQLERIVALHEAIGMHHLGTYHRVGWKMGTWWDVAWYEKHLE